MNILKRVLLSILFITGIFLNASLVNADVAVIVHPDNSSALDASQIRKIYLGKVKGFPNGEQAMPLDLEPGAAARTQFIAEVLKKDEGNLNSYWARMIFSSKGKPPKVMGSAKEVKQMVAEKPGAIGYIDAGEVDGSVKVVLTIP